MKKLFTFAICAVFALSLQAQSNFIVSPTSYQGESLNLAVESMSENGHYAAGTDMYAGVAVVWNITDNTVSIMDSEGTAYFHDVNDNGVAVGTRETSDGESLPVMYDCTTGTMTDLYAEAGFGSEAYGITNDGSIVVGFYFDAAWTTHACIWTNNGATRTDLPVPTAEELGFAIDYASARWISEDGNVVLGYVQDYISGAWVAVSWQRQGDTYVVNPFCSQFFQVLDEEQFDPANANPYIYFEPVSLSANGEWATLMVIPTAGLLDESLYAPFAARYNLVNNTLELLDNPTDMEYAETFMFGIANNGDAVGRCTAGFGSGIEYAVYCPAGETSSSRLNEMFADDAYVSTWVAATLSRISNNEAKAAGYAITQDGGYSSFVVTLGEPDGITDYEMEKPQVKGIFDLQGRQLRKVTTPGIYIVNGKKVFVRE